ncbi:MAG: BON domain-containing protein [Candidatus Korobacteraceae bacterium]|jgi:osmotically-inducible protein OsmY
MRRLLLFSSLLIFCAAAVAQTSQGAQTAFGTQPSQAQAVISSNGPVVVDYGKLAAPSGDTTAVKTEVKIANEVRHQLLMLPSPYYGMFDDLEYSVQGRTVTLSGDLTSIHSQTKRDAENAVKRIEGVDKVVNNIRVLPPSPFDDQARGRVYRALARAGGLAQYFWPASPDIRIIVANQRVTLKGYVHSEGDKNLATIAANQVRDLLQVTNDLQVVR